MNARFSFIRALPSLFLTVIVFLASGCATRQDTLYVPSEARYGSYPVGNIYYSQLPPQEVVRRDPVTGGCIATRYDTAVPFSVAAPCVQSTDVVGGYLPYSSPGSFERSRYERSVLDGLLVQARQQLQEVCTPATVNARMGAEALVTGVLIRAISQNNRGAVVGAVVGTLSGYNRSVATCQQAVDWHHYLLVELGKELRYQKEVVGAQCRYTEVNGRQTRVCGETEYGSWRNKK